MTTIKVERHWFGDEIHLVLWVDGDKGRVPCRISCLAEDIASWDEHMYCSICFGVFRVLARYESLSAKREYVTVLPSSREFAGLDISDKYEVLRKRREYCAFQEEWISFCQQFQVELNQDPFGVNIESKEFRYGNEQEFSDAIENVIWENSKNSN